MNTNSAQKEYQDWYRASGVLVSGLPADAMHRIVPLQGVVLWSEKIHPVYEAVAEVRLMPSSRYAIWHHHGDRLMAWQDNTVDHFNTLAAAIAKVREYQNAIAPVTLQ